MCRTTAWMLLTMQRDKRGMSTKHSDWDVPYLPSQQGVVVFLCSWAARMEEDVSFPSRNNPHGWTKHELFFAVTSYWNKPSLEQRQTTERKKQTNICTMCFVFEEWNLFVHSGQQLCLCAGCVGSLIPKQERTILRSFPRSYRTRIMPTPQFAELHVSWLMKLHKLRQASLSFHLLPLLSFGSYFETFFVHICVTGCCSPDVRILRPKIFITEG